MIQVRKLYPNPLEQASPKMRGLFMIPTRLTTLATFALAAGLALGSPSQTSAALCEESFNLQTATQYVYTTSNTSSLGTPAVTQLATDLSNMRLIFDSTQYEILAGFDGACGTFTKKPVRYRLRNKGGSSVNLVTVNDYYVRMFDSNTVLTGQNYGFWFGFSLKPDTLVYAIGKGKGVDDKFTAWFGTALFLDSTRNTTSGLWSSAYNYQIQTRGPYDSAYLDTTMLKSWKNIVFDANRKGTFTVQLIKVTYDAQTTSVKKPRASANGLRKSAGFSAHQIEGQVRIRLDMPEGAATNQPTHLASVELYDMFGHKVATLHATGNDYIWNGKTLDGYAARGGVYFAQSRGKVLGKFFLAR
jgi:hypothetical protein